MVVGLDYAGGVLVGGLIWRGVDSLEWCRGRGGWVYGRHCQGGGGVAGEEDGKNRGLIYSCRRCGVWVVIVALMSELYLSRKVVRTARLRNKSAEGRRNSISVHFKIAVIGVTGYRSEHTPKYGVYPDRAK